MSNIEGYENLANAIVRTAVQDYLPYYKALQRHRELRTEGLSDQALKNYNKELRKLEKQFDELIDFFYSPWFTVLTGVDPQLILAKLEAEVDEYERQRVSKPNISA